MKITFRTLSFLVLLLPLMVCAQASSYMNNPMVRVIMDTYASMLRENPQDYVTYFNRAKEYYRYGDYNRAMDDLNEAIRYYPREAASDLSQAYTIRGLIYEMWDKDDKAVIMEQWSWLKEVAKIPGSYIIEREISNIWNQVVFNDANLRSTISDSIIKQDKEISRKMQEFGYMDEQGKVIKTYIYPTAETVKKWKEGGK